MQFVAGLLSLVYIGILIWLGYSHTPAWIPLVTSVVGVVLYAGNRPVQFIGMMQRSPISALAMFYVTQVMTAYVLFGIGWAIGTI